MCLDYSTPNYKRIYLLLFLFLITACGDPERGMYFDLKEVDLEELPVFQQTRPKLAAPIYEENPLLVECYWKAWEIAFENFNQATPQSGFVSNYIDAAFTFGNSIYFWDTGFMTMFCNYAHPYVPGIQSMDNFYARQHPDGEICREIHKDTGLDHDEWVNHENRSLFSRYGTLYHSDTTWAINYIGRDKPKSNPVLTLDALNHPIAGWIELESYRMTGDKERLKLVWKPLVKYYEAIQLYLRQGNGLYITDWASMDNSPRNDFLINGGCGIDTSSEMVLYAENLAEIAQIIGKEKEALQYSQEADALKEIINDKMWDKEDGFYYDLTVDEEIIPIKTVAAFWPLLAGVASQEQAEHLFQELNNPATFNRPHRVPTLSAAEAGYDPLGAYWKGGVWAPIVTMVIRGLERYEAHELASDIAMNHLNNVATIYQETGTIWENYAPDSIRQGNQALDNFVGWSGIAPILYFIEYAIGIKADAITNTIKWNIGSSQRVGIEKFWFGGKTVSLICEEADKDKNRTIRVTSDGDFKLDITLNGKHYIENILKNKTKELVLSGIDE
jgi:hypothetical protein